MVALPKITDNFPKFADRYRLYIDESGDHVFRATSEPQHRFLCLLGCWFQNQEYLTFHNELEKLKTEFLHHHPDEPVVLHREDIINKRNAFKVLQNDKIRNEFDQALLDLITTSTFKVTAVIIDKAGLKNAFGDSASHPYHLGLGFLLQRYAGYLNLYHKMGDVMAEARGNKEDLKLEDSYKLVYERGIWHTNSSFFQSALTSKELKIKKKTANISGLQLADIIGHPAKIWSLNKLGYTDLELGPFAGKLMGIIETKFNFHENTGKSEGYGYVVYPKK